MLTPKPIHHKRDLLAVLYDHAPTRACARAMREGKSTVLGGFTPPEGLPYWLIRVESTRGQSWLVGLTCDEENRRFGVIYPEAVDWKSWDGRIGGRAVKDGDTPNTYALNRAEARRRDAIVSNRS